MLKRTYTGYWWRGRREMTIAEVLEFQAQQRKRIAESKAAEAESAAPRIVERWEDLAFYPMDADKCLQFRVRGSGAIRSVHCDTLGLKDGEFRLLLATTRGRSPGTVRKGSGRSPYTTGSAQTNLAGLQKKLRGYFGPTANPLGRKGTSPRFKLGTKAQVSPRAETSPFDITED